ncbi:hypothetical protein OG900_36250 [Streptomyces sp. NBC_00433]
MTAHDHEQGAGPVAGPRAGRAAGAGPARESPLAPGLDPARTAPHW